MNVDLEVLSACLPGSDPRVAEREPHRRLRAPPGARAMRFSSRSRGAWRTFRACCGRSGTLAGTRADAERAAAEVRAGHRGSCARVMRRHPAVRVVLLQIWHSPLHDRERGAHDQRCHDALRRRERLCGLVPAHAHGHFGSAHRREARGDTGRRLGGLREGICRAGWRATPRAAVARVAGALRPPGLDSAADAADSRKGARIVCAALDRVRTNRQDARRR